MDWHDKSCKRLDLAVIDDIRSCIRCGSFEATKRTLLPPIRQRTELRILHLRAGRYSDDIVCDISTQDLSSSPQYEALSYTWATESGDTTKCKTISLSGMPFQVTQNCENALRRVRHLNSVRHIWIDAICIDQYDTAERGHQVQLMHRIYAEATRVLIYIGEADQTSDRLLDILSRGIYEKHRFGSLFIAVRQLFSRRYFYRAWVIQEVALARSAVLICGEKQLGWGSFCRWCLKLGPRDVRTLRIPPLIHIDHRTYASPNQLLRLLDMARDFIAADPRDKVYAILGLIIDADAYNLDVDYGISVEELYTRVALQIAVRHGWAAVLRRSGKLQQKLQRLPSWVPDWSVRATEVSTSRLLPRDHSLDDTTDRDGYVEYNEGLRSPVLRVLKPLGFGTLRRLTFGKPDLPPERLCDHWLSIELNSPTLRFGYAYIPIFQYFWRVSLFEALNYTIIRGRIVPEQGLEIDKVVLAPRRSHVWDASGLKYVRETEGPHWILLPMERTVRATVFWDYLDISMLLYRYEKDDLHTPQPPRKVLGYLKKWAGNKRAPCPLSEMPELMVWYEQPFSEAETAWLKASSEVNGSPILLLESGDLSTLNSLTWKLLVGYFWIKESTLVEIV
ncbi:hypothetical protein DL765_007775 [Monosporascus sp. GIB2]|nr:hypothetical protein DL765_007775 [Monosporascus sp. GIB2]